MKRLVLLALLSALILAACVPGGADQAIDESRLVTIYKLPT